MMFGIEPSGLSLMSINFGLRTKSAGVALRFVPDDPTVKCQVTCGGKIMLSYNSPIRLMVSLL